MTLAGTLIIDRDIASDDLWMDEPFSRGQAWFDLMLLANDRPRTLRVRGNPVDLDTGELGHSELSLADRWQWSRNKVRSFLEELRDRRKISFRKNNLTTVVRVLDYAVLNPEKDASRTAEGTAEGTPDDTAEGTQNRGIGESGKREEGKATPQQSVEIPPDAELRAFFAAHRDLSIGLDSGIPESWWAGWVADRLNRGQWPVRWQRAALHAFRADWLNPGSFGYLKAHGLPIPEKNGAAAGQPKPSRTPAQERFEIDKELEDIRGRLNSDHELNLPPDKALMEREQQLEKRRAELGAQKGGA